ncbi:hypothetical protein ANANG_G00044650 [Anguilla anguilla]|uniref:CCHC-type domain-containing protein n=1 Tax=Anguilla anguilla TaxID=7936 RepID=A0A9D3MXW7_ANGAN|nr:hypothetical protein ANANG_G00044650 [Anguilla anguilla]
MAGGGVGRPSPAPLDWGSTTGGTQLTPHSADGLRQPKEGGPGPSGIQPGRTPATVQGDGPGQRGPTVRIRAETAGHGASVAATRTPVSRRGGGAGGPRTLYRWPPGGDGELGEVPSADRVGGRRHPGGGPPGALPPRPVTAAAAAAARTGRHGSAQESPSSFPSFPPFFLPSPCPNPRIFPQQPFFSVSPAPGSVAAGYDPQRAPQTPGPGCWRCGQPGHLRRECPLMEVGQVVRVVGPPTSAPDPDGAYCIP